jgi:hypothetical protein
MASLLLVASQPEAGDCSLKCARCSGLTTSVRGTHRAIQVDQCSRRVDENRLLGHLRIRNFTRSQQWSAHFASSLLVASLFQLFVITLGGFLRSCCTLTTTRAWPSLCSQGLPTNSQAMLLKQNLSGECRSEIRIPGPDQLEHF